MSSITFREHLQRFISIDDQEYEQILTYFTVRKLRKNERIISAGDKVNHTYWITKGLLVSTYSDPDGKDHIIQFAHEGCWITDQNAFYHRVQAEFNITCIEDSEMLCLSYENRERLCADMHKMERFFRKKANDSFTKQQKRLLTFMTTDTQQGYELFLKEYPALINRLSKKVLAAYLGVSRESLSRLKRPTQGK